MQASAGKGEGNKETGSSRCSKIIMSAILRAMMMRHGQRIDTQQMKYGETRETLESDGESEKM